MIRAQRANASLTPKPREAGCDRMRAEARGKLAPSFRIDSHWMNTMVRCAVAAVAAACLTGAAWAQQQRSFPQNTLRGAMVFGEDRQITLNGRAAQLSPGSRIRNQDNMVVMASTLVGARLLVHYTIDMGGEQVRDVWILRPEEAAVRPWPTTLQEAQTWNFDPTTQTWTKP
jgi:hypothetical protein